MNPLVRRHTEQVAGWVADVLAGEGEAVVWDVSLALAPVPPSNQIGGVLVTYVSVASHAHIGGAHSNVTISPIELPEAQVRATVARQLVEVRRARAEELTGLNGNAAALLRTPFRDDL